MTAFIHGSESARGWVASLLIFTGIGAPGSALAQEAPSPELDSEMQEMYGKKTLSEIKLEDLLNTEVTTAARKAQKMSEAPARIVVITREQIQRRSYKVLRDVFRDLPGYQAAYQSTAEWGTNLVVRGLSGNHRIVFLLDGQRFNPPGGENMPLFANYPMLFVDHVEVMFGPGSAMYGSDAFSGIINVVTLPRDRKDVVSASFGYGMAEATDGAILAQQSLGELRLRLGLHYTHSSPPNLYDQYPGLYRYPAGSGGAPILLSQIPSGDIDLSRFYADEDGNDVTFSMDAKGVSLRYHHRDYLLSSSWDRAAVGSPFVRTGRFADAQDIVLASHEMDLGRVRLTSLFDYVRYQVKPRTRFVNPIDLGDGTFDIHDHRGGLSSAARLEEKLDFSVWQDRLDVTAGASVQDVRIMPISPFEDTWDPGQNSFEQARQIFYRYYTGPGDLPDVNADGSAADPNPQLFEDRRTLSTVSEVQYQVAGLYAQLVWKALESLQLTAGLRTDYSARFGFSVNPRLAVVWKPRETSTLKLLYGHAYLEPTPFESYGHFLNSDSILVPNPELDPEVMNSVELVYDQALGEHVQLSTGGFMNRIDDILNETTWTRKHVYVEEGDDFLQRKLLQTLNSKAGTFFGSETTVLYNVAWVRSFLHFSWVTGKVNVLNRLGQSVTSSPEGISDITLKVGLDLEPLAGLVLNLRGSFHTEPFLKFTQSTYPSADKGAMFFVLDGTVRYTLTQRFPWVERLSLFLKVQNATDARYVMGSGRPSVNPLGTPQPSLLLWGGLEADISK